MSPRHWKLELMAKLDQRPVQMQLGLGLGWDLQKMWSWSKSLGYPITLQNILAQPMARLLDQAINSAPNHIGPIPKSKCNFSFQRRSTKHPDQRT